MTHIDGEHENQGLYVQVVSVDSLWQMRSEKLIV
jgi:hypothetical protein